MPSLFAVTTVDVTGSPHTSLSSSRDQAISHFMKLAYLFCHELSEETLRVVGNDEDAALAGLHLIWDAAKGPVELVSLTVPSSIKPAPGWSSPSYENKPFCDLGSTLDAAVQGATVDPKNIERFKFSRAAMAQHRSLALSLLNAWDDRDAQADAQAAEVATAWDEMGAVEQHVGFVGLVSE